MILEAHELKTLLENIDDHSVSIYMPTYLAGKEAEQGPIRFRNLLVRAERQLLSMGMSDTQLNGMFEEARRFAGNRDIWEHQSLGLAAFLSPALFRHYRLPVSFEESVIINSRFSLKQLVKLLAGEGRYFVLWLRKGGVRLFDCTRDGLREISVSAMPKDIGEALEPIDTRQVGQHAPHARHSASESHPGVFHGHGSILDTEKTDTMKYFRQVDKAVHRLLRNETAPLLLCGVEYLHALYRDANTYNYLVNQGIRLNPQNHDELHRLSWNIMRDVFDRERAQAINRFLSNRGTGLATEHVSEIVPAADDGRVRDLFVETTAHVWGEYDPPSHSVSIHDERRHGDEDLLDLAAIRTLLNGGSVYAVDHNRMPKGTIVSAVYRY